MFVEERADKAYNKKMFKKDIFRAYDIRGIYPDEINKDLARNVAITLSKKFFEDGSVVVGRDIRIGSEELQKEATAALEKEEREVIDVGIITTPMLTFLVNDLNAAGGVIITASHNPKEYNGIKMLGEKGIPISGEDVYKELDK